MASELQETLQRIIAKSDVLIEKYRAVAAEKDALIQKCAELNSENLQLKKQVQQLSSENDYLKMARVIAPNREQVEQQKAVISKIVRDINKCISQLTE